MARGMVLIDVDRCKGCGLCTHVCPPNILVLSKDTLNSRGYRPVMLTDAEACLGCASCALICPEAVFTVYRQRRGAGVRVAKSGAVA